MLKLVTIGGNNAKILHKDLTTIDTKPADVKELHSELFRICKEKHGVGISANQVGVEQNFFFIMPGAKFPNKNGKPVAVAHICINPTWEPVGEDKALDAEGCLSLPGQQFEVERYAVIKATWTNVLGHTVKRKLKGMAARVFQHEHDHLRGVILSDHAEKL